MSKRKKSQRKKRPIAVSVIAIAIVVLFLVRLYQVFNPLFLHQVFSNGITDPLMIGWQFTSLGGVLVSSGGYLLLSIAGIVVLIAFLRLRRWSWVMLMAWTGLSLIISLVDYFYSRPNYVVMASNVIIAFALNIKDIQLLFGIRAEDAPNL